ncbi:hypothetical protein CBOM_00970 [Ceraceosorus bombacis]|uniref:Uncharacterized protein n=1 Tax=Ceraceosorus bombacis TaxID=401625 RepID=A0A0P1BC82_9BASI|nr:hypothetical protein CBOM_00970 [Ceraceosorus bombacis]
MRSLAHACAKSHGTQSRVVRCATLQIAPLRSTSESSGTSRTPKRTTINPRGETIPSTKTSQVLADPNDDLSILSKTTARLLLLPTSTRWKSFYVRSSVHRAQSGITRLLSPRAGYPLCGSLALGWAWEAAHQDGSPLSVLDQVL